MRAQLCTLRGVQRAFQEGAENRRFDLGPDMLTGLDQHFQLFGIERDRGAFLEQVAVELLQRHTECGGKLALVHRRPQRGKRSEEHTSELQSLMRISYAVFRWKKNKTKNIRIVT